MADTKITALAAITTVDPAADVLPIVDISDTSMAASGTTKKITTNQILGSGGTATLASATISGAANFNGGALAGYLNGNLMFGSSGNIVNFFAQSSGFAFKENTGANNLLTISNAGVFGFLDGAGSTRMTLNSTGLGVGALPLGALAGRGNVTINGSTDAILALGNAGVLSGYIAQSATKMDIVSLGATFVRILANGSERYKIDSTGVATWSNVDGGSGTAMTLNATGLGVGTSPSYRLDATDNTTNIQLRLSSSNNNGTSLRFVNTGTSGRSWQIGTGFAVTAGNFEIYDVTAAANRFTIDSSGNVGIGVTPSVRLHVSTTALIGCRLESTSASNSSLIDFKDASTTATAKVMVGSNGDALRLFSGGNVSATLDSSGNVGIGVTPSYKLDVAGIVRIGGGVNPSMRLETGTNTGFIDYNNTRLALHAGSLPIDFVAGNTTKMTLTASGDLLVGKTASLFSTVGFEASQTGFLSVTNSASTNASTNLSLYSTGAAAFRFYVGLAGTVFATNTTISAISDARLKENVQDIDVGLGAILALKPRKFDWKAGKGKDIKGDRGFIAQEFETVFPNLIDEWKDNAPEGEAPYKSVRQDLIPVLVKAIQELTARVEALEA